MNIELTTELLNDYIKSKNTTLKNANGFYIQKADKFFIGINKDIYKQFKKGLLNRRAEIITENEKIINQETNKIFCYFFIDTHNRYGRKSAQAHFKKYGLIKRKTRVLNPNYRNTWKNENQSRDKA